MHFDYSKASPQSIDQAADLAISEGEDLIARVVGSDSHSYEDVLAPLDEIGDLIGRGHGETAFLGFVHPDADMREMGRKVGERLSKWAVDLAFRDDLYTAVKNFAETDEAAGLTGERARLLEFTLRDLRKAGHELDPAARARVKEMTNRLVELGVGFEQHIADNDDALIVVTVDLEGLPDGYLESLPPGPDTGTYRVTMAYPHVVPFLDHARRRDLRAEISRLFNSRAVVENRPLLEEAIAIRAEIAGLFGAESWAEHQLDERMAMSPANVETFYSELRPPLTEKGRAEIVRMADLLEADEGVRTVQVYDWRYYDTQLRKTVYGVDPAAVAAYFPLQQVLDGIFGLTGEVFGLRYVPVEMPSWHPDVIGYGIDDVETGSRLAHFHMDLFPREGKFSHAAAFTLVPGRRLADGGYQRPVSAIVANFTKPTADRPSLLMHTEVETLFHEFGHILHQTLTTADLVRFSGTSTETDFVEAPSQIMEHWVWKPDVLRRFARHHETGEPIPDDLVERLTDAKRLNIALSTLRQMTFGSFDLELHGPGDGKQLDQILRRATEVSLFPFHEGTFFPASFGHLMAGYDAGYYGYLWSEVFGDDMFSRFETEGYTSPEVGRSYRREILETGGTRDGMDSLRAFLGREPDNRAFLANLGIEA